MSLKISRKYFPTTHVILSIVALLIFIQWPQRNIKLRNEQLSVLIECVPGDTLKYEMDYESNRVLPDSILGKVRIVKKPYPFYYGCYSGITSKDGDYLDCFVITDKVIERGRTTNAFIAGVMMTYDSGVEDAKLVLTLGEQLTNDAIKDIKFFLMNYSLDSVEVFPFKVFEKLPPALNYIHSFSSLSQNQLIIGHVDDKSSDL